MTDDDQKPPPEPKETYFMTGVFIPFPLSQVKAMPVSERVQHHAIALAKQYKEDNGRLPHLLALELGCTPAEANDYIRDCHISIMSKCAQEMASALNYIAKVQQEARDAYLKSREGKESWEL